MTTQTLDTHCADSCYVLLPDVAHTTCVRLDRRLNHILANHNVPNAAGSLHLKVRRVANECIPERGVKWARCDVVVSPSIGGLNRSRQAVEAQEESLGRLYRVAVGLEPRNSIGELASVINQRVTDHAAQLKLITNRPLASILPFIPNLKREVPPGLRCIRNWVLRCQRRANTESQQEDKPAHRRCHCLVMRTVAACPSAVVTRTR